MQWRILVLITAVVATVPLAANAQFSSPAFPTQISIQADPTHPTPGEAVTLTLTSSAVALSDSDIEWYVNEEPFRAAPALRSVTLSAGELGERSEVTAIINAPDGAQYIERITLAPTVVDLVWEANTYTPPFYRGRPLPSAGSTIYAEARPTFLRADGSEVPPESLIYTWERDGRVLEAQSGRGRSRITLSVPQLSRASTLTVTVRDRANTLLGQERVRIPVADMHVTLHNDDPVLGIMYHQALGVGTGFSETEAVVAAAPYFTSITSPYDDALTYQWEVDGEALETDPEEPFRLILQLIEGARGSANVSLTAAHTDTLLQQLTRSWQVSLGANAETPSQRDPFRRRVE